MLSVRQNGTMVMSVRSAPQEYVPVFFSSLLQPIVDLFDNMEAREPRGPNEVQAASTENGYSLSIIVLTVFVLESALNRTRYVRNERGRESPVRVLDALGSPDLAADLQDLFVVRNVIVHNHIWRAMVRWDDDGEMRLLLSDALLA